jgi:UDP-N-acetylglucosamine pyrophosphorylase
MKRDLAVVIMAAGKGTRMKNPDMAKVMYPINGRPMIDYVIDLALELDSRRIVAIVGWQKDTVIDHLRQSGRLVEFAEQTPQLGTGHAVMQAEPVLKDHDGNVLVLSGDVPTLSVATMKRLIDHHDSTDVVATVLTAEPADATGYGRILRGDDGTVIGIVEHRDATEEQRGIREINSGIYVFDSRTLFQGLQHITPTNVQREYYLTDVFGYFWRNNLRVAAVKASEASEIQGINNLEQLEEARSILAAR